MVCGGGVVGCGGVCCGHCVGRRRLLWALRWPEACARSQACCWTGLVGLTVAGFPVSSHVTPAHFCVVFFPKLTFA